MKMAEKKTANKEELFKEIESFVENREEIIFAYKMLRDGCIISKELSEKMINMAKFRNLLVHLYWKVDDEKIYEILQSELYDFDEFIKQIARGYL